MMVGTLFERSSSKSIFVGESLKMLKREIICCSVNYRIYSWWEIVWNNHVTWFLLHRRTGTRIGIWMLCLVRKKFPNLFTNQWLDICMCVGERGIDRKIYRLSCNRQPCMVVNRYLSRGYKQINKQTHRERNKNIIVCTKICIKN